MTIRKVFLTIAAIFVIAFSIQSVFASGVAVFHGKKAHDSTIELEYLNRNTIRMNIKQKDAGDSYMLIRDAKAYTVAVRNGKTHVMDMASLGGMAKNMGIGSSNNFDQELLEVKKTGRKETVAGYKGDVYSLTWRDQKGTHTSDAVLSSHRNVREFSNAWMNMARIMASSVSGEPISDTSIWNFLATEDKGMLRFGNDFVVTSIVSKDINKNRFILPAKPMQMPGFGNMFSSPKPVSKAQDNTQAPQQRQPEPEEKGGWMSVFQKKSDRQVDRQKNNAEHRVDSEVDSNIDKAIDKALDKVFSW